MGDLGLDLVRTGGRAPVPVEVELGRELNEADLALLMTATRGVSAPAIKQIRDSHHALARCMAMGMTGADLSNATGYSPSRISILKDDPAFQELLAGYRNLADDSFQTFYDRLVTLGTGALSELQQRLEDNPDDFSKSDLMQLGFETADRTGHGKKNTTVNVNVDLASRLEAARKRSGLAPGSAPLARNLEPVCIEGTVVKESIA